MSKQVALSKNHAIFREALFPTTNKCFWLSLHPIIINLKGKLLVLLKEDSKKLSALHWFHVILCGKTHKSS